MARLIQQLNDMFGGTIPNEILRDPRLKKSDSPVDNTRLPKNPATLYFLDYYIKDWSKSPYVLGGYSSPSVGEDEHTRVHLAAPIDNRVFFAGEATARSFMTIHGTAQSLHLAD